MAVATTNRAGGAANRTASAAAGGLRKPTTATTAGTAAGARRVGSASSRPAHGVKRPSSDEEQVSNQTHVFGGLTIVES
jgi:hypothetical protein